MKRAVLDLVGRLSGAGSSSRLGNVIDTRALEDAAWPDMMPLEHRWRLWRGSAELLHHVARVGIRAIADASGTSNVPIEIAVAVDRDSETFTALEDFRRDVTPEALRRFSFVHLMIGAGCDVGIAVTLRREEPGAVLRLYFAQMMSGDTIVEVQQRLIAAVSRGYRRRDRVARASSAYVFGAGLLLASWLLAPSNPEAPLLVGLITVTGFGVVIEFLLRWLLPNAEVAPPGHTRFDRFMRTMATLVLGLIAAGLTKRLYG